MGNRSIVRVVGRAQNIRSFCGQNQVRRPRSHEVRKNAGQRGRGERVLGVRQSSAGGAGLRAPPRLAWDRGLNCATRPLFSRSNYVAYKSLKRLIKKAALQKTPEATQDCITGGCTQAVCISGLRADGGFLMGRCLHVFPAVDLSLHSILLFARPRARKGQRILQLQGTVLSAGGCGPTPQRRSCPFPPTRTFSSNSPLARTTPTENRV